MKRFSAFLGIVVLLVLSASNASALSISLVPASQSAASGDIVSIDLVVDGLTAGGPVSLGDFDVDVTYATTDLTFLGYSISTFLGDAALFEALDFSLGDVGGGVIDLAVVSLLTSAELDGLQSASGVLATLDFQVDLAAGGTTVVAIDGTDPFLLLGDASGQPVAIDIAGNAVIRVEHGGQVPIPSTLWLLTSALLLGAGCLDKRSKAA